MLFYFTQVTTVSNQKVIPRAAQKRLGKEIDREQGF
jgi:hypothetical protein